MAYKAIQRSFLSALVTDEKKVNRIFTDLKDKFSKNRKKFNKFCDEYAKWIHDHGGSQHDAETALAWLLGYTVILDNE